MKRLATALARRMAGRPAAQPEADSRSKRREIGDAVLRGRGYEFGAGLRPSRFAQVEALTVIDKRTPDEVAALFGSVPDYPIVAWDEVPKDGRADFVTAHHVVEHLPDPIGTLAEWTGLLRTGGVLYLSVPSSKDPHERLREVTPIAHLVLDFILQADGTDFDSRQHIQSFIQQWTAVSPDSFWFARDGVQAYAEGALGEQRRTEGHDLHWHTFSLETLVQLVEAAFYLSGAGLAWEVQRETESELFVVARKTAEPRRPAFLAALADRFRARLDAIA